MRLVVAGITMMPMGALSSVVITSYKIESNVERLAVDSARQSVTRKNPPPLCDRNKLCHPTFRNQPEEGCRMIRRSAHLTNYVQCRWNSPSSSKLPGGTSFVFQ